MARTAPAAPVTKARVKRKSPESYKTHRNAAALLTALSRRVADGAKGATATPPVTDHEEERAAVPRRRAVGGFVTTTHRRRVF